MKITLLSLLYSTAQATQGYLQLRMNEYYEQNYGAFKLDLCASDFEHHPRPEKCRNVPNHELRLVSGTGMVARATVTKRSRQIDFPFNFSWPGDLSIITWVNGKSTSFHGDLNPTDGWKPIKFGSYGLLVDARIICEKNYYGADCNTFCVEEDSYRGHYTCDVITGKKVCKDGWETLDGQEECTSPVCESACSGNGVCVSPGQCRCEVGFEGADCSVCVRRPGCVHGSCGATPFTCACYEGFVGANCDCPANSCRFSADWGTQLCLNGGVCHPGRLHQCSEQGTAMVNTILQEGAFTCSCPRGFIGARCERELTCRRGGELNAAGNACDCPEGVNGVECEIVELEKAEEKEEEKVSVVLACVVGIICVILIIMVALATRLCVMRAQPAKPSLEFSLDVDEMEPALAGTTTVTDKSGCLPTTPKEHATTVVKIQSSSSKQQQLQQPPSYSDVVGASLHNSSNKNNSRGESVLTSPEL